MSSSNRPIPQGGAQRANLSKKYAVLGPLSGVSAMPEPLGSDSLLSKLMGSFQTLYQAGNYGELFDYTASKYFKGHIEGLL